jgi:hypothetical protein
MSACQAPQAPSGPPQNRVPLGLNDHFAMGEGFSPQPQYLLVCSANTRRNAGVFSSGYRRRDCGVGPLAGARNRLCRQDWGERQGLAFEQSPYFRADVTQDRSDCQADSCR